jgi:S-adenosylmethionine hydrolase
MRAVTWLTLLTDFGTVDGYVGAMKGVLASRAPDARIVDLTHDIPPQDIDAAAFALAQAAPYFPDDTVHVVVVDPGVGGTRRPIIVDDGRHRFVGPDNGVFALAAPSPRAVHEITAPAFQLPDASATFHGRDVFAPAAAALATGAPPAAAGPEVELLHAPAHPRLVAGADRIEAPVVHVDRFGNLITGVRASELPATPRFRVEGRTIPALSTTFESVARGQLVAYVGSGGTLEVAIRDGSAAEELDCGRGTRVEILDGAVP